jgi:gas vesicle protein
MKRAIKFMMGVLVGAAAGAIAVTLLTPDSGSEARKVIVDRFESLRAQLQEASQAKREELEKEFEGYRQAD